MAKVCKIYYFLGQNCGQADAKIVLFCCKICAHLSGMVCVAVAKREGLEVAVCVDDVSGCGVEVWCGAG